MTRVAVEKMRQHVLHLCAKRDYCVTWCTRPSQAKAMREWDEIEIPPIRSAISYAVALHELGHFEGQHQNSAKVIVRERWAWRWAQANALVWTPRMARCAAAAMAWYGPRSKTLDALRASKDRARGGPLRDLQMEAIRARVDLVAQDRGLSETEIKAAKRNNNTLLDFASRHDLSIDWLFLGDLRGLLRQSSAGARSRTHR